VLIHILTAVSRPENLTRVGDSIFDNLPEEVDVMWWHRPDPNREYVGGQWLKNRMLEEIGLNGLTGWVCILDDDTLMHPSFLRKIYRAHRQHPEANAIVVSQKRTTGVVLQARPENMVVGKVDAGQAVIRRSLIGDLLIPETYAGDGEWLECLLYGRDDVHYMSEVLSLHNVLSGVDVSETPERMGA
jgi:hypothetical protein